MQRRNPFLFAFSLILLAGGLALAGPPALRWSQRAYTSWQGESIWKEIKKNSGGPVARLSIVDIGLAENILYGASEENLALSPAFVTDTSTPTILAHRDTHFNPLKHLEIGMEASLETRHSTHLYTVTDIEIHTPESLDERLAGLHDTENHLLLVTCYPFRYFGPAPERFLVICGRIES